MNMRLSEIKISADFESSIPNTYKYNKCENYYNKTWNQDRYIVVDEKNVLVDGYIMYLVLKNNGVEFGDSKRITLRKHTYTDKQRKKYYDLGYNYIDHVGETKKFVDAVLSDSEKLFRYLFGDSFIITGNDNDDSYRDRMCTYEGEEETDYGSYPIYGDLKPEFNDYEIYEKGN